MSTITINQAVELSFGMPASGDAFAAGACTLAWPTPAVDAFAGTAARTHALSQGVVATGSKRRTAKGSLTWRTPDC